MYRRFGEGGEGREVENREGIRVGAGRGGEERHPPPYEERTSTPKSREWRVECQELRVARRDESRVVGIREVKADVDCGSGRAESRESRVGEPNIFFVSIKALGSRLESDRFDSSRVESHRVESSQVESVFYFEINSRPFFLSYAYACGSLFLAAGDRRPRTKLTSKLE